MEVALVSGDRDLLQIASDHINPDSQNQGRKDGNRGLLCKRCGGRVSGNSGTVY